VRSLLSRARSLARVLFRRRSFEAEMDEEFRLHIDLRTEDLVRSGMTPAEAARQARIEFGAVDRFREEARESRGLRLVGEVGADVRYTARSLRREPGFTVAAVLTLALGIGVNAAVFSLVSASLLRPLPFDEADRLVVLHQTYAAPDAALRPFPRWSYQQVEALQSLFTTLSHVAAYYATDVNLSDGGGEPERVRLELVSSSYFPALRIQPALGRAFLPQEDSLTGAHPVAILSRETWERRYGGDPGIVGREVLLNGVRLTVVGVAPAGFRGLTGGAELWIPHAMAPPVYFEEYRTSDQYFIGLVGKIAPGSSIEQARTEVETAGARAAAGVRAAGGASEWQGEWGAGLQPLEDARRDTGTVRAQLVLAGAALFVLMIGLVNLSGLLLARSTGRSRETAVRAALGARRRRLVRQGLVEGGMLGVLGGTVGVLLASWSVEALVSFAPEYLGGERTRVGADIASFAEPGMDWRVVAFAAALAVAAGLLAGLLPALRATRGNFLRALKVGARGSTMGVGSLRRPTLLSAAVSLQVACALVLLVGAGMLLQGFHRLQSVDRGFDTASLLTFRIAPPEATYGGAAAAPLLERVLERVEAVPGVRSATVGSTPFEGGGSTPLFIEGRPIPDSPPIVGRYYVGPDHFRTLGIPLIAGRALTAADRAGHPRVAVISEAAARRHWPGEDPIGRRVWFGSGGGFASPDSLTEVVGVVGDVLYGGEEIRSDFYTSYLQFTWPSTTVTVRAVGDPLALVASLRRAVTEVDANLPIHDLQTMEELGAEALAAERFAAVAFAVFAALALLLASLGVYGIMSYSVAQRRREVGIRLALGATPHAVRRFVIGQGLALAAVGMALGAVAALWLVRALPALIAGVGSGDAMVFMGVAVVLLSVALLACYLPARAAARVDPVETLAAD